MSSREYEPRETNSSRNEESSNSFILGALIGGMVGAAAALLFAPKSGRELRSTLSNQAGSIMDKTGQLRENVVIKSGELASKTSSLSQGIVKQSSEIVNKVKGKTTPKDEGIEESESTYIPLHNLEENKSSRKSIEIGNVKSFDVQKKLEEAQKAFDEEESKVKH